MSASRALQQIILSHYPKSVINIINISPPFGSPLYRFASNYLTEIFIKQWHAFNSESAAKLLHLLLLPAILPKVLSAIKKFRPNLIIATQAFSAQPAETALNQLGLKIPYILVLVDPFSIHRVWTAYKSADKYLLPNDYARRLFRRHGIASDRLAVIGHPIRPIPHRLTVPPWIDRNKLIIFLGGNGEGIGRIDQIINRLIQHQQILKKVQLIVTCGKNQLLLAKMRSLALAHPGIIFPYGYTHKIYELMNASHLAVGKAGPNFMFEAIALGKPILTTGLPLGQERGNYRFIAKEKLGIVTYSPRQTVKKLLTIINQPHRLEQFRPAIKAHQRLQKQTPRLCIGALRPFLHK